MFLRVTASADTYITDKVIDNQYRATDANLGKAATIDLYKLYNESTISTTSSAIFERTRGLIKFNYDQLNELMTSSLDLNHGSFKASLKMFNIQAGNPSPANIKITVFPLAKPFDEGIGRDVSTYADLDSCNYITSSYSDGSVTTWAVTGANQEGLLGQPGDFDIIASGNLSDGDGIKNLYRTAILPMGTEDLSVDITTIVSATVAGILPNNGLRISLSGTQDEDTKTRFVKRFATRHCTNLSLRPYVEVSYDDTINDHHESFFFDLTGSVFLNNFERGMYMPVKSGSGGDVISGSNCMKLTLRTGSYEQSFDVSQHQAGTRVDSSIAGGTRFDDAYNYMTGVYSASISIPFSDTTAVHAADSVNTHRVTDFAAKSGSLTFETYWHSLDGTVGYHTGSLTVKRSNATSFFSTPRRLLFNVTNALPVYRTADSTRFRVFVTDLDAQSAATRKTVSAKSVLLDEVYYRVKDADSGNVIVPFKTDNNATRLSTDAGGMYFDFRMDNCYVGRVYTIEFMVIDRGLSTIEPANGVRFRVDA